jgi:hypothetical protein
MCLSRSVYYSITVHLITKINILTNLCIVYMKEQGGFIVSIKTSERVDFDRLSSKYIIDVFQHTATFDEEKKQFIIDRIINLEQIGQLVCDGYS